MTVVDSSRILLCSSSAGNHLSAAHFTKSSSFIFTLASLFNTACQFSFVPNKDFSVRTPPVGTQSSSRGFISGCFLLPLFIHQPVPNTHRSIPGGFLYGSFNFSFSISMLVQFLWEQRKEKCRVPAPSSYPCVWYLHTAQRVHGG